MNNRFKETLKTVWVVLMIQFVVYAVLIGLYVRGYRHSEDFTPSIDQWQSRMLTYDNGWEMTEQIYHDHGFDQDGEIEIIYGPYIALPKGEYTLSIDYDCDDDQAFRVYAFEQEDKITALDEETLPKTQHLMDYHYVINDNADNVEIRVSYNGRGQIQIHDIQLKTALWDEKNDLIFFAILFVLSDLLLYIYLNTDSDRVRFIILSFASSLSFCVNLHFSDSLQTSEQVGSVYNDNHLMLLLLIISFYGFYAFIYGKTAGVRAKRRGRNCLLITAVILSLCVIFGYSFQETDSWSLVFNGHLQLVKAYIVFSGLTILFYYICAMIYEYADTHRPLPALHGLFAKYVYHLRKRPFTVTFITLLILKIPFIVFSYPATLSGDSPSVILQAFNILHSGVPSVKLISPDVILNQHHPVPYTLLVHYMLLFGTYVLGSSNIGIAIVPMIQLILMISAVAYLVKTMAAENAPDMLLLLTVLFYVCFPRMNLIFIIGKDMLYMPILLFSVVLLWKLITGKQATRLTPYMFVITQVALSLLRNEVIYTLVIQMVIYLIFSRNKFRLWITCLVSVLAIHILLTDVIYPMNKISPTTVNEALSIPIQQTGRYFRDHPEDVSAEEFAVVDQVLEASTLAEDYDPELSDPIKGKFRIQTYTNEDLAAYLKVWAKMLLRHPGTYIQATLNNSYRYYYPGKDLLRNYDSDGTGWEFDFINSKLYENDINEITLGYPLGLRESREKYNEIRRTVTSLPGISLFISVGLYTWILLIAVIYGIYSKNRKMLLMLIPMILIVLVWFAGPENGYARYSIPFMTSLPALLLLLYNDLLSGKE